MEINISGSTSGESYCVRPTYEFAGSGRDIADPWYTGNFDDTYRDVKEGCEGNEGESLAPVAKRLEELLGQKVNFVSDYAAVQAE